MGYFLVLVLPSIFLFTVASGVDVDKLKLEEVANGVLFEGDMVVSRKDLNILLNHGGIPPKRSGVSYGLTKDARRRWPDGIVPYVLDDSVINKALRKLGLKGPTEKAILSGMKKWEEKTCLRFKERTNERDYVEFFDGGKGRCYSSVGRQGGKQQLSLGFGCFTAGIATHEIGHSIGLWHEQSRPDRDNYVTIIWDNIKKEHRHNFATYGGIDSLGSPYDYDSIMHYGKHDFATWPWKTTIRTKNGVSIGQRSHVSKEDAWQINKWYGCKM